MEQNNYMINGRLSSYVKLSADSRLNNASFSHITECFSMNLFNEHTQQQTVHCQQYQQPTYIMNSKEIELFSRYTSFYCQQRDQGCPSTQVFSF